MSTLLKTEIAIFKSGSKAKKLYKKCLLLKKHKKTFTKRNFLSTYEWGPIS